MNILSFKTSFGWITLSEENNQILSVEFGKKKSKGKSNNQGEDLFTPSDNNSQKSVEMTKIKK